MIYEDFKGFCFTPETIGELISLENLRRESMKLPVYGEVNSVIRQYWDYVCFIERNNTCSLMELYEGGIFDQLYDFAEGNRTLMGLDIMTEYLGQSTDADAIRLIGKLACLREITRGEE